MRLGDGNKKLKDIETIPTGSLSLDIAAGIGGVPKGRIVEILIKSVRKNYLIHIVAEAQKEVVCSIY